MMRAAVVLAVLAIPSPASATWSIVAVDRTTSRIVIASATCVDRDDDFLKGVQAVVVPGKGVAACQAAVDNTHQNQMLVFQELQKGTDPKDIINLLSKDPAYQSRQFGIVDLQGRRAGHSGLTNGYVSQDVQGQVPGTEIFYSIQGNILRPGRVVPNAVQAFVHASGAMRGANRSRRPSSDAARHHTRVCRVRRRWRRRTAWRRARASTPGSRTRRRARRRSGDDARVERLARRRRDSDQVHAGRRR